MDKNMTLNIRINSEDKKSAEQVLSQLGVPMATAIGMFLKQVVLTGGIPFLIALPKAPNRIDMDVMSATQIRNMLSDGMSDISNGKVQLARDAFARFKDGNSDETL